MATKPAKAKAAAKPAVKKAPAPAEPKSARASNAKAAPAKARTRTAPAQEEKIGKDPQHLSAEHQKAVDERIIPDEKLKAMKADVEKALEAIRKRVEEKDEDALDFEPVVQNLNSLHGALSNVQSAQGSVAEDRRQRFSMQEASIREAQENQKKAEAEERQ
jgi:regulator of sigma D